MWTIPVAGGDCTERARGPIGRVHGRHRVCAKGPGRLAGAMLEMTDDGCLA